MEHPGKSELTLERETVDDGLQDDLWFSQKVTPKSERVDDECAYRVDGEARLADPARIDATEQDNSIQSHTKIRKFKMGEFEIGQFTDTSCPAIDSDDNPNCKANGCWMGVNINGENGFSRLDHRQVWLVHETQQLGPNASYCKQVQDPPNRTQHQPCPEAAEFHCGVCVPLHHDGEATVHSSCESRGCDDIDSVPVCRFGQLNLTTSPVGHLEFPGYHVRESVRRSASCDSSLATTMESMTQSGDDGQADKCRCLHFTDDERSASIKYPMLGDIDAGLQHYSHVAVEKSSPVVVSSCSPQVHVAKSVVSCGPIRTPSLPPLSDPSTRDPFLSLDDRCLGESERLAFCFPIADGTSPGEIGYVAYGSELQMPDIMRLIQKDLSEPYSIYTYRYFIHNWPKLCFLAMDGDKCVGAIVCKLDLHKKVVRRGYIAMLAVDEHYRKRKIGSNLVLKAIQAMVEDDADEVVLETEISNKPALRLYENLGFVRDKRLFRYYLNGVDALRLKLWLR